MQRLHLNDEWQIVTPKYNYWQIVSYLAFIAFIFTAFSWSVLNQKLYSKERDVIYLKAENSALKQEIVRGNHIVKEEFDITDRVVKRAKKIYLWKTKTLLRHY